MLEPEDQLEDDLNSLLILEQVELVSFTANPTSILPFQSSLLQWSVRGPESGWSPTLSNTPVPRQGSRVVTPVSTTGYALSARARRMSKHLGSVTVTVDESSCETLFAPNSLVRAEILNRINAYIAAHPDISTRRAPEVTVDANGISLRLALSKSIDYFPNPKIDVDARWTYYASNGGAEVHMHKLKVSVSVPWYAWAYPGAVPALAIALSMAEDSVSDEITSQAQAGTASIEARVPDGFRLHSVRHTADNVEIQSCPARVLFPPGIDIEDVRPIRE